MDASELIQNGAVPAVGGLLALGCLLFALRAGKRLRLVENLPTSKTTGVFIGLVEIQGTAEAEQPLISHLTAASLPRRNRVGPRRGGRCQAGRAGPPDPPRARNRQG